jgi:hypothetical protein
MDSRTKANSISVLVELRDAYQGQLDAGVVNRINEVIAALEDDEKSGREGAEGWAKRALNVIAEVVQIVTNISELMK